MSMRIVFILLFCFPFFTIAQTITILDSIIVKKKHQDVVALNIEMSFPITDSALIRINKVPRPVVSDPVVTHSLSYGNEKFNVGLIFIVENANGQMIPLSSYPGYPGFNPVLSKQYSLDNENIVHDDCAESRCVWDEENASAYYKKICCDSLRFYDNQSLVLSHSDTLLRLYPLLFDNKLQPGQYKLYLYYYYNPTNCISNVSEEKLMKDYYGELFSNKVTLIVEDCPVKWWEFWKKKGKFGQ